MKIPTFPYLFNQIVWTIFVWQIYSRIFFDFTSHSELPLYFKHSHTLSHTRKSISLLQTGLGWSNSFKIIILKKWIVYSRYLNLFKNIFLQQYMLIWRILNLIQYRSVLSWMMIFFSFSYRYCIFNLITKCYKEI